MATPRLQELTNGTTLDRGALPTFRGYLVAPSGGGKRVRNGTVLSAVTNNSHMRFKPALATVSGDWDGLLYVCTQGLSVESVDATQQHLLDIFSSETIVEAVDTSTDAVGDLVYLSDTISSTGYNWSTTPGTNAVPVGLILSVSATAGRVLIAPQRIGAMLAARSFATPPLHGEIVIADLATFGEVTVGAKYVGGTVIYSQKVAVGSPTAQLLYGALTGSGASTKVRVTADSAPGSGKSITASYVVFPL
jgi:hypothetical protein